MANLLFETTATGGGLSVSNANGRVHIVSGLTTGVGGLIQEGNVPFRYLLVDHDISQQFRVGTIIILALESTGATVSGQLVVNGVHILSQLNQNAASSTTTVSIDNVTGLYAALNAK